jgi:hypothetical protein
MDPAWSCINSTSNMESLVKNSAGWVESNQQLVDLITLF